MSESLQVLHRKERLQEDYSTQQLCLEQRKEEKLDSICRPRDQVLSRCQGNRATPKEVLV